MVSPVLILLLIILAGVVAVAAGLILGTLKTGTPPMPISPIVLSTLSGVVAAAVKDASKPSAGSAGPRILDAGSGWGTILRTLAAAFPRARLEGVERSPVPCTISRLRPSLRRRGVRIHCGDLFRTNLQEYDVMVVYLSRRHMTELAARSDRLAPVVISVAFALPGYSPSLERRAADIYRTPVYLYRF